jgi:spermidine/putrescine transport system ATP-binding protein
VELALTIGGISSDKRRQMALDALDKVGLKDQSHKKPNQMSGGQMQRVAIARALVNEPEVLLLDEPLGALDLKLRKEMQLELKSMQQQLGITFLYVTHDQEEALTMSDTIVVMNEGRIQQIGTPIDIYNEPVNAFVADFIGESNILNGTMIRDRRVSFIGHDFDCVDEGFGENTPVDVVVRPEDIYFTTEAAKTQFTATVKSCVFKGVHYEMFVDTDTGNELMIQDYDPYPVGSTVQLYIDPDDIQVMKKERTTNALEATVSGEGSIELLGGTFECNTAGYAAGDKVRVEIPFDAVDLQDDCDAGELTGEIHFILYKGDHYHLTVKIDGGGALYVDTNDIWDKGDLVGVKIPKKKIRIVGAL